MPGGLGHEVTACILSTLYILHQGFGLRKALPSTIAAVTSIEKMRSYFIASIRMDSIMEAEAKSSRHLISLILLPSGIDSESLRGFFVLELSRTNCQVAWNGLELKRIAHFVCPRGKF
eukprot:819955-Amphidinium_carterae.1